MFLITEELEMNLETWQFMNLIEIRKTRETWLNLAPINKINEFTVASWDHWRKLKAGPKIRVLGLRIHISPTTKYILEATGGFEIVERGEIQVKGKGLMKTFWLIREISGKTPGAE